MNKLLLLPLAVASLATAGTKVTIQEVSEPETEHTYTLCVQTSKPFESYEIDEEHWDATTQEPENRLQEFKDSMENKKNAIVEKTKEIAHNIKEKTEAAAETTSVKATHAFETAKNKTAQVLHVVKEGGKGSAIAIKDTAVNIGHDIKAGAIAIKESFKSAAQE